MIPGAWLCLAAPLAGALLITLLGTRIPRVAAGWISTTSVFVAFAGAVWSFFGLRANASHDSHISTAWTWLQRRHFKAGFEIMVRPLSTMLLLLVPGGGGLVVLYSMGSMHGADRATRSFANVRFF